MRIPHLVLALALFSGVFAGCLGNSSDEAPPAAVAADSGAANESANTSVDDGTMPMSDDLGHMPHLHDYWQNKERITLLDADVNVDAPTALFWTFVDAMSGTPGVGGAQIRLPDGQTVFEGTGKLEFTATWSDPTVTGMGMAYRTPAESRFGKAAEVKSAAPVTIDVTPEMTDMPHAKTSRWQFLIMPSQAGQAIVGKFHVKVDIIRVGDIALFPGHPALFDGAHTLEIFKGSGSSTQNMFATDIANFLTQQSTDDGVMAQQVVPMETRSMTGNVTVKAVTGSSGAVKVYLLVKPADRNGYSFLEPIAKDDEKQTYSFAWLVNMTSTDSPYATESDWKFDLFTTADDGVGGVPICQAGCASTKVDYDLEVVAYDNVVDGAKELQNRQRGGGG